ncbi:MAG: deaminase [Candidatus Uhrbacteria bacterium]|nr:deaminase [Candidatus Uhrbacteria bacterium]
MNNKITTLKKIRQVLPPHRITLMSGSFEPFNEYYFRLLRWASGINRPLVVMVQKDDMVTLRRGFNVLSTTHKTRAEMISSLEFVDFVIVTDKTAHDAKCIKQLRPKIIAFQNDNTKYRKILAKKINQTDPKIRIKIAPFSPSDFRVTQQNVLLSKRTSNKISKTLLDLAKRSDGRVSKVSAVLVDQKNQIVDQASNSAKEEHAEILLLNRSKSNRVNLSECSLYILIPPCLMCATEIAKHRIKRVFYLYPYGDRSGIQYLLKKDVAAAKLRL